MKEEEGDIGVDNLQSHFNMKSSSTKQLGANGQTSPEKGKPKRDTILDHDDVLNLQIALGLHRDVEDLFQDRHLFEPDSPKLIGSKL